ncbi:hypothetical protein DCCM_3183 [Desulfocucumis palustris]|uniref:Uncharacterized protein n=1 Tax=Desulfocucumis palustris TaxID=1898651 RepID=A0A2L2XJG2_9FIRM|nr:hypothetical protein DCCM_3183 [Desulfocucumis palustris]
MITIKMYLAFLALAGALAFLAGFYSTRGQALNLLTYILSFFSTHKK